MAKQVSGPLRAVDLSSPRVAVLVASELETVTFDGEAVTYDGDELTVGGERPNTIVGRAAVELTEPRRVEATT